jgi:hypothetical protein
MGQQLRPGQNVRAPNVGRLQDRQPGSRRLLLEVTGQDRLDLVAPVEPRRRIVVGEQRRAV